MKVVASEEGELVVSFEPDISIQYPRSVANQLIRCARMNDWDRFIAMWKLKSDPQVWAKIESVYSALDVQQRWKMKETFARLATVE